MSEFSINIDRVNGIAALLEQQAGILESARDSINSIKNSLSIEGMTKAKVISSMKITSDRVQEASSITVQLGNTLRQIAASYGNAENKILGSKASGNEDNSENDIFFINNPNHIFGGGGFRPLGPGGNPHADWIDRIKEIFTDESDSEVKTILKVYDKWGKEDEAGILNDIIDYLEKLSDFLFGDKEGLTGISAWLSLTDSSIGVWKGLYDYFQNMYKGLNNGFFGEIAQKNVKILGLSAGIIGFISSILSASNGIDEKNWQSIVADYVDSGKDLFSVIKSGYDVKHIGDIKSLSELKAGVWSALDVYTAIVEAGIESISQGFSSHEKYYADGYWDIRDTGATGIDVSIAGIYGIAHSLTLGLDDLIYGLVDSACGGNGTGDMSYVEKAAEGYRILASKLGEKLRNWLDNLTK